MNIGSILGNALTGLQASQTALTVTSQNIANANTPGYVRAEVRFAPNVLAGVGGGVNAEAVVRAADRFLAQAQRIANATQGASTARADLLDRAQLVFGDPNGEQNLFTSIDSAFSAFQSAATDPASSVGRRNAVSAVQDLLAEFSRTAQSIESLRLEADTRLGEAVSRANGLLSRIADLNAQVVFTKGAASDSSSTESARDQLIDELSGLIDVRTTAKADGSLELRTQSGVLLVGYDHATLSYTDLATAYGEAGSIIINRGLPTEGQFDPAVGNGQIAGLIRARDSDLPGLADALAGLAAQFSDALNEAHANTAGYPPASTLVGRQTGLLSTDSLSFTGSAVIALVDGNGVLQRRLTVDFDAGTITTENPADTRSFTNSVGNLATRLNEAMQLSPALGTADFSNGVLTLSSPNGVVVGDVAGDA